MKSRLHSILIMDQLNLIEPTLQYFLRTASRVTGFLILISFAWKKWMSHEDDRTYDSSDFKTL